MDTKQVTEALKKLFDEERIVFWNDPVSRNSQQSLFIQVADLVAYAAFRRVYPGPTSRKHSVVPDDMWDELGPARMAEVNQRSGGPSPGIVTWPRQLRVP